MKNKTISLVDLFESMLGALEEKIENFSRDRAGVIIGCSLTAGLSIPVAWYGLLRISVLWRINTPSWKGMLSDALVSVSCYMAAGVLLILARVHKKLTFDWFLVVVLGSLIFSIFEVGRHLDVWGLSAYVLIFVYLREALEMTVWLSLFTLPIAAAVKYSGS